MVFNEFLREHNIYKSGQYYPMKKLTTTHDKIYKSLKYYILIIIFLKLGKIVIRRKLNLYIAYNQ